MTAIEWCHRPGTVPRTWNPTKGCSRVSEGCRHCYAEAQAARIVRMGKGRFTIYNDLVKTVGGEARWTGKVVLVPEVLAQPLKWREPSTVFVNSMSDLFHESLTNEQIAAVFGVMAACPQHTFIILTKRAERLPKWYEWLEEHIEQDAEEWSGRDCGTSIHDARRDCLLEYLDETASAALAGHCAPQAKAIPDDAARAWPLPNVWIGVSVENQEAADERIPHLLATPAAVRILSCEPLLGPLDLTDRLGVWTSCPECGRNVPVDEDGCCTMCGEDAVHYGVDWVIAGCESGPGARPCDVAWLRSLRDQCMAVSGPFFLKQAAECNDGYFWEVEVGGDDYCSVHAGPGSKRKASGVIGSPYLDGVQHLEFPRAA